MRSRELGIRFGDAEPGPLDAITDVAGVRVGSVTLHEGEDVRTGVTVILPSEADVGAEQLFAGCHTLNGNGELTGLEWVRESGRLTTPIALTNTHSVGVVRDALVAHSVAQRGEDDWFYWALPVVGETWDGMLNDINGQHVRPEHVDEAIAKASDGPVEEGARRRRHGDDLPRLQGRHGHRLARDRRRSTAATRSACWCRPTTAGASA